MNLPALTGIISIIIGMVYSFQAFSLPDATVGNPMAPKVFPIILGVLMILLGIILFVKENKKKADDAEHDGKESKHTMVLIATTCASIIIYAVLFNRIGYVLSTIIFMSSILFPLNGVKRWKQNIIVAVVFSVGIYFIFMKLLAIPLPLMPIFEI